MKKTLIILLLAFVALTGCAFNSVLIHERESKDLSLFYGYVGFEEGQGAFLTQFTLKRLDGDQDKPYYHCSYYRGVYFTYLPPGVYRVEKFVATEYGYNSETRYNYEMPAQGNGFEIKKPSLYFFNSLRIRNKTKFFSTEFDYDVEKADWPTEEQVLERMLDVAELGSSIEKAIKARMMQYRKLRAKR